MKLSDLTPAFADGLRVADASGPIAVNQRSGAPFQPGIGPHTEKATIGLALGAIAADRLPTVEREVPYPRLSRQKCDLVFAGSPGWAIEVKMLRFRGNNNKPNDNMLLHLLSPYAKHRSAVTDCVKLGESGFAQRKAILIYGYEYDDTPLNKAIDAFETLARQRVSLGPRHESSFDGLIHPVHQAGSVFCWEVCADTRQTS